MIIARYRLETDTRGKELEKIASDIAIGQTVGTYQFHEIDQVSAFKAEVLTIEEVPENFERGQARHCFIEVAYPLRTVSSDLGTLLTVVFGKLSMAGRIRLDDLKLLHQLPETHFPGPAFGMNGIREQIKELDRPLLMSIFKPCLGLSPEQLGRMFFEQAVSGINLVKDDEILSDTDFESTRRRLEACLKAGERAWHETGKNTLYVINLTGPAHTLLERANLLVQEGAQALLFNYLSYGLPMLADLRTQLTTAVPIVGHPSLAGSFYGSSAHGISPKVLFGRLPRLAGADMVLFPSPYGSVALPKDQAFSIAEVLRESEARLRPVFPVPSAGIKPAMVAQMVQDFGVDMVINAGTGIYDHPEGPKFGVLDFITHISKAMSKSIALQVG